MQVPHMQAGRKYVPRGAGDVFTEASLADQTYFIDGEDGLVLRLWLPGGIALEDVPSLPWNLYMNAGVDEHMNFVVTKFWVQQKRGGPGVTAAALRSVPFGEVVDELLSRPPVAQMVRRTDEIHERWPAVDMEVPAELLAEARRRTQTQRGRPANPEEVRARLEQVAVIARTARPGGVLTALKNKLHLSDSAAKKALRQAREAGLLEHSTRSKGGQ
jgi:hypothetical protein